MHFSSSLRSSCSDCYECVGKWNLYTFVLLFLLYIWMKLLVVVIRIHCNVSSLFACLFTFLSYLTVTVTELFTLKLKLGCFVSFSHFLLMFSIWRWRFITLLEDPHFITHWTVLPCLTVAFAFILYIFISCEAFTCLSLQLSFHTCHLSHFESNSSFFC